MVVISICMGRKVTFFFFFKQKTVTLAVFKLWKINQCSNFIKQMALKPLHQVLSSRIAFSPISSLQEDLCWRAPSREIFCQWCRHVQYFCRWKKKKEVTLGLTSFYFTPCCLCSTSEPFFIRFERSALCLHALWKRRWSGNDCLWQNEAVRACNPWVFDPSRCQINIQSVISHCDLRTCG